MPEILVPTGEKVSVDEVDVALVAPFKWHVTSNGYVGTSLRGGRKVLLHRLIAGVTERSVLVDHQNRNKLDNRRSNLRLATRCQNAGNLVRVASKYRSRFKGVSWHKHVGRWVAQLKVTLNSVEKNKYLGTFEHEEDAAKAYDKAAREHFGNFARLNFV